MKLSKIHLLKLSFCFIILFSTNTYAEWQLNKEKYIGDHQWNTLKNYRILFSKKNKKLYLKDYSKDFLTVIDPETFVGVDRVRGIWSAMVNYPDGEMLLDDERKRIFYIAFRGLQSHEIDANSNRVINSFNLDGVHASSLDQKRGKIFCLRDFDNPINYLSILDLETLNLFDITITTNNKVPHIGSIAIDIQNNQVYCSIIKYQQIKPQNNIFFESYRDSILIFDVEGNKFIKSIPIWPRPRNIFINNNSNEIYIYSSGEIYVKNTSGWYDEYYSSTEYHSKITIFDINKNEVLNEINLQPMGLQNVMKISTFSEKNNLLYCEGNIISCSKHAIIGKLDIPQDLSPSFIDICINDYSDELYVITEEKLYIYNSLTGKLKRSIKTGEIASIPLISPQNNSLYFIGEKENKYLEIMYLGKNKINNEIKINELNILNMINNSQNDFIYILTDKKIIIYNIKIGVIINSIEHNGNAQNNFGLDEALQHIYVFFKDANSNQIIMYIYDALSLVNLAKVDTGLISLSSLDIDTITHRIYALGYKVDHADQNSLAVIDGIQYDTLLRKEIGGNIFDIILDSHNGKIFGFPEEYNGNIAVYDNNSLEKIDFINTIDYLYGDKDRSELRNQCINYKTNELFVLMHGCSNYLGYCGDFLFIINTNSHVIKDVINIYTQKDAGDFGVTLFGPLINQNTGEIYILNQTHNKLQIYKDTDNPGYIPPSPPLSLYATIDAGITVSWSSVNHADVQGYNIYRSPHEASQWMRLNNELVTYTSYLDETAVPNVPYDYRIATMGLYNIEGEPSESITATLVLEPDFRLSPVLSSQSASNNTVVDYYITSESIEQFAKLIDLRVEGLTNGINYTISPNPLRPGEVTLLRFTVPSAITPGEYQFEVVGKAGNIEHRIPLKLKVVKTELAKSTIALDLGSSTIEYGSSVFATGKIIPAVSGEVSVTFSSIHGTETQTATSSSDGTYAIDFEPPSEGEWTAKASWTGNVSYAGAESEERTFEALSGRTKITCTTDAPADAQVGWQMTIKGKVFPNPEVGNVTLYVKKPDGTENKIDGLLVNELGYYGYNITADQPGFWEVTSSWAGNDKYLGSVSETLVVPYGLDIGRAIIAVCQNNNTPFYYTANRLGKLAYKTFSSRRFDSPRIQYFDVNLNQDLNGDGFIRDVAGEPSLANIEKAINEWAAGSVSNKTPLCLYLIGVGSLDGIELSDGKRLTASRLHELISQLELKTGCKDVVIVVDAPHSGTFVRELSRLGRCVVTSTNLGDAQYIAEGKLSFSQFFCNASCEGKSIRDAFLYAKNTLSKLPGDFKNQDPLVESEGNVIANESGDFLKTAGWYFGSSYGLQDLMPRVKSMSLASVTREGGVGKVVTNNRGVLSDDSSPTLKVAKSAAVNGINVWLKVDDAENNISSVYAVVFSPSREVLDEVELVDGDGDGKYEGKITSIDNLGTYDIVGYALDASENVSEPMKSLVVVVNQEGLEVSDQKLPESFKVYVPYPNPFNPTTTLRYEIPEKAQVEIMVYDILGQKVKVLQDGFLSAGVHEVVWDGKGDNGVDVGSGVYLYQVKVENMVKQGKMVLVR